MLDKHGIAKRIAKEIKNGFFSKFESVSLVRCTLGVRFNEYRFCDRTSQTVAVQIGASASLYRATQHVPFARVTFYHSSAGDTLSYVDLGSTETECGDSFSITFEEKK